jgi:hypothetical protein
VEQSEASWLLIEEAIGEMLYVARYYWERDEKELKASLRSALDAIHAIARVVDVKLD